ncbi:MAG TPA: hypothetical protein RMH99_07340 [Sandaracinaceae bacterium LLY-WYZ-13_1]|nr:hypothetical protein [Sandaracinaceae bacterium LLY-WYZ-13_1]
MTEVAGKVLDALLRSVDRSRLDAELAEVLPSPAPKPSGGAPAAPGRTASAVLHKIVLSDILDDSILGARPGDTSFPLRMFFGTMGDDLDDDTAFALANGINFYFRVPMDEESRVRLGLEVSRTYYRFARERPLDETLVPQLSPLLARLMSTELELVAFEAVDAAKVFDSSVHEREPGSDASSAKIVGPESFLCRVVSNGRVRAKAAVRT